MLKLKKEAKIEFEGQPLEISPNELGDFLLGSISEQVSLEDISVGELMHLFYHLKTFIYQYYLEEYEGLNALISSGILLEPITKIIVYKELIISENGEIMMIPKIRTENSGEKLTGYFNVKVEIDNNIKVIDESGVFKTSASFYSHITLLELLGAIFEEFQDYITVKSGVY